MNEKGLLSILHVEDNRFDAELIMEALIAEGIVAHIDLLDSEDDYRSALERNDVDLILSDFSLPTFDGRTALALAKQKRPEIPFIYVSGTISVDLAVESLKVGATDFVLKNQLGRLGHSVRRALKERSLDKSRQLVERERDRLTTILKSATDFVYQMTDHGRFVYMNEAAMKALGLTEPEQMRNLELQQVHPSWALRVILEECIPEAKRLGTWSGESALLGSNGDPIYVSFLMIAHKTSLDRTELLSVIARDNTRQKLVELELRESESRFRAVTDSAGDGIISTDSKGHIIMMNSAAEEMFRSSSENTKGKSITSLLKTHVPDRILSLFQNAQESGGDQLLPQTMEMFGIRDDSIEFPAEVSFSSWRQADAVFFTAFIRDISRRVESEIQMKTIVESSPVSIIVLDPNGIITSWNKTATTVFGWDSEEVVGKPLATLLPDAPDDFWREPVMGLRTTRPTKQGKQVDVMVYGSPYYDNFGRLIGIVRIGVDITETKLLEHQYHQAQKMEAVGQLAGGVAHDFNNLLTVMQGYAQLGQLALNKEDPLFEYLEEITTACDRAKSLTTQLLAFSRKQVLQPSSVNLNEIIEKMHRMLKRLIGEDMDLVFSGSQNLWRVLADAGQLEQVVLNLVVNARDAMPKGGQVTIETKNIDLDEEYAKKHTQTKVGEYVLLSVTDTGVGMTEEIRSRIFEPFFTTKDEHKGTGLGLATVFGIVNQSDGHIEVYSELNVGTSFKVYLPRTDSQLLPSPNQSEIPSLLRGTEMILVVEDDASLRRLTSLSLRNQGYEVLEAAGGQEAIRLAKENADRIVLILTDVVMPKLSGPETVKQIESIIPNVKSIFLSGYTDDAIFRHGILEGEMEFLQKPYTMTNLLTKIREIIDRQV